jgi:PhnB protein
VAKTAKAVPDGYSTVTPQLTLDNCAQAIEWYTRGLGARELSRSVGPDGKIMHAEIQIGNSRVMLNDAMMGQKGPKAIGGSPASLWLFVEDSDTLFNKAIGAGAKAAMPMDNQFWGDRAGAVTDPAGYTWWIATRKEDLSRDEMNQRAQAFFKEMSANQP